jgi:hypothetical protein
MSKFSTFAITQVTDASTASGISLAPGGALSTPTLSGPTTGNEGTTVSFTITNYNAAQTYIVAISGGSVSRNGSTISWVLPTVNNATTHYLLVQSAFGAQTSDVITKQISVSDLNIADNAIFVTNFGSSNAIANSGWTV